MTARKAIGKRPDGELAGMGGHMPAIRDQGHRAVDRAANDFGRRQSGHKPSAALAEVNGNLCGVAVARPVTTAAVRTAPRAGAARRAGPISR